jgi:hypothetical protein
MNRDLLGKQIDDDYYNPYFSLSTPSLPLHPSPNEIENNYWTLIIFISLYNHIFEVAHLCVCGGGVGEYSFTLA